MTTDEDRKGEPHLFRGVQMRSHAEARMASYLDYNNIEWVYEPERIGPLGYLPDFYIPQEQTYLEVKPPGVSLSELAPFYSSAGQGQNLGLVYVSATWQLLVWDWYFELPEKGWIWLSQCELETTGSIVKLIVPGYHWVMNVLPSWLKDHDAGRYSRLVYYHPHPEWDKKK